MKLRTNTKILVAFIFLIMMIISQLAINHKMQSKILDNTRQIKDVEDPLQLRSEREAGYDAGKTQLVYLAILIAQNGNLDYPKTLKTDYYDPIVDKIISSYGNHQVETLVAQSRRTKEQKDKTVELYHKLSETGDKVSALETQAFEALDKNNVGLATSLVLGDDYQKYKLEMVQSTESWIAFEGEINAKINKDIVDDSQMIIYTNLIHSIVIIVILLLTLMIIRGFVTSIMLRKKD